MPNVNAHDLYLNNNDVTAWRHKWNHSETVTVCLLRKTVLKFIECSSYVTNNLPKSCYLTLTARRPEFKNQNLLTTSPNN